MKSTTLSFIFIFVLSTVSFSQNIPHSKIKSTLFQDDYKESFIVLAEKTDDSKFLLVRSYKKGGVSPTEGYYIEEYDTNLKFIRETKYDMKHPNNQKYNLVVGILLLNKIVHIIEIYYDLKQKAFICMDNKIPFDGAAEKVELFQLSREDLKEMGSFNLQQKYYARANEIWTNENSGNISSENNNPKEGTFLATFLSYNVKNKAAISSDITIVVNENKTAFAIALDLNQKDSDELKLMVFDSNSIKIIDTLFSKKITDKNYIFQNIQIDKKGESLYLLAKSYNNELRAKTEGGKYYFELTKITAKKQDTKILDPGENFIGSLKTFFHNNDLICLGFYSGLSDFKYKGICYFKLDSESLDLNTTKYNPFTEQFFIDKYGKQTEQAVKFLKFKNVHFNKYNELIITAEEFQKEIKAAAGVGINGISGPIGKSETFYFDDIIVAKISESGNLEWARNINKKQSGSESSIPYLSYTSIVNDDNTFIFLNTTEKIKKLSKNRIEFGKIRKNKSNLSIIQINKNGDFEFEEILDDEENDVPFMVGKGAIIDNSVFLLGKKGRDKQLLKITL